MAALATQGQKSNEGWTDVFREGHGGMKTCHEEQLSFFPETPIEALCMGVKPDDFRLDLFK